jgi:periplasmic divalent cation tolerance protein
MIFIYVTCKNLDMAKTIAKSLVEKRMAGSVDIMLTTSVFQVKEGASEADGAIMIIKTIDKHIQGIEDIVREHYQNGTPCIASITLYRLNRDFKDKLIAATS